MKSSSVLRVIYGLALFALACILVAGLALLLQLSKAKRIRQISDRIIHLGGTVEFESEVSTSLDVYDSEAHSRFAWLKNLLGEDPALNATKVLLESKRFGDSDLLELCRESRLDALDLECSNLTDFSIRALGGQKELKHLSLRRARITDNALRYICRCTQLRRLMLGGTGIHDAALQELRSLAELQELELAHTKVGDPGLSYLTNNTALRWLSLAGTRVTDDGIDCLTVLTNLTTLDIQGTEISDRGLRRVARFTQLRHLLLPRGISDLGLRYLKPLSNLQTIVINDNRALVTDEGLQHLNSFPRLRQLSLGATNVTLNGLKQLILPELQRMVIMSHLISLNDAIEVKKMFPHAKVIVIPQTPIGRAR